MTLTPSKDPLVWIDCEMTGLDVERDTILQIACFITDYNLNFLDHRGYQVVIHHEKEVLDEMNTWCRKHHGASGLIEAAIFSKISPEQAATGLFNYICAYVPEPRRALLAGSSVHVDKAFLRKAPYDIVINYLHYRILDVSALKEAARRWAPVELLDKAPRKRGLHEAKADILDSIEEARYYRDNIFR